MGDLEASSRLNVVLGKPALALHQLPDASMELLIS
jgi:hypothetical protein